MAVRRGFYFTFDALIALSLIGVAFIIISGTGTDVARNADIRTQDAIRSDAAAESALQISLRQPLRSALGPGGESHYLEETVLEEDDLDRPVMDAIAILWGSGEQDHARNLTRTFFDDVVPDTLAYRVAVDESGRTLIYNSSAPSDPAFIARASRLISGVARDRPTRGFIASATLQEASDRTTRNVFFGGYVGDGNITANVSLPGFDGALNVSLEGSFAGPFDLSVNGVDAGHHVPEADGLSADTFPVCTDTTNTSVCDAITGNTTVRINFTTVNRSIGGGRLQIRYNRTRSIQDGGSPYTVERKRLHGIDGIVNLFSSFSVPGTLHGLSARLHYRMDNRTTFLKVGNATIYENRTIGEADVSLTNDSIHSNASAVNLSYAALSNTTVPLRLGIRDIEREEQRAIADAVSVVDVSGSMDGSPLQEAQDAAKTFAHIILNASGNRAGLVAYESGIDTVHPLTADEAALNGTIDGLTADGSTCIGCGILEAIEVGTADRAVAAVEPGSEWRYNTSFPGSTPPTRNGTAWTEHGYPDDDWSSGDAILGTSTNATTDTGTGNDTYLRTTFFANREYYRNYTVFVRSNDAAEVYLNGVLLDNDTGDHAGREWNRIIGGLTPTVFDDSFERTDITPWTQTSGDGDAVLVDDTCGATDGSSALILRWGGGTSWFGPSRDPVRVASPDIDLSDTDTDTLAYDIKPGGTGDCEPPEIGEDIITEFQAANGTWIELATHPGGTATGTWTAHSHDLPPAAMHDAFRVRYRYPDASGEDNDYWAIDRVRLGETTPSNFSALRNGENTLAVKLTNDDATSEFDLAMNLTEKRRRFMVVMSDGEANVETSMEDVPDHNDDGFVDAADHAIEAACRAREDHDITVHAVAFGEGAAEETLNLTAQCGGGEFYVSDTGELEDVFRQISSNILNASFVAQQVRTLAGARISTLYRDSYVEFNYTRPDRGDPGTFDLQQTSDRFGGNVSSPKNGSFTVPDGVDVVDATATSYSANYWTDRLLVQNASGRYEHVYRLWRYGQEYRDLGDPFHVQIPPDLVTAGTNNVSIDTGVNRTEPRGGSPDNRVIYTLAVDGTVPYGFAFGKAEGGTTTVQTVGGPVTLQVGNASDGWNASNDAVDNATARLLAHLDVDDDGVIDVQLSDDDLVIDSQGTSGLEWLWGPAAVSLEVWKP